FYREILDRSTLLHLDNLLGGSVCLVNYWVLSESQETIITNKASILIYPSEYKITVSHVDYFPAIFSLQKEELVAKSQYRLNASLKPRDGVLTINTQIETKIYQGSSFVGFSGQPLNLKAKNTHTLWLKADGYKDKQIDVRLGPNQRITHSYEMQVAEGTLQIELLADPNIPSEILPKTVYVRLNDEGLEIEMLLLRKLTLDIGKYGVSLRVPGWKVLSSEPVRIRQNQKTTAQFSITPEKTTVRFESNVKASVWLGEKRIGNTGELIDIIPGMHAYTLKSPLYRNKNISLLSYPGDAEQRSVKMVSLIDESKLSFVTINAHRKNKVIKAAIYKKGRLVGQSGEPIALTPEVKHILVVKARGYDDRQVATSELEAGKTYTKPISVQLKKKDKGDGAIMSRLKKLGNWL
ncbi:MAG: hypothetical protein KAH23_00540, partial [Kiritimatiellae bacterium]|nr:hypothetical protein [Kiritimatiellia bacterium]